MGETPAVDAPLADIAQYAMSFNAYQRWYGDIGTLAAMLKPLQEKCDTSGEIPSSAGADALRAWLFLLIRAARFSGGLAQADSGVLIVTDPPENPMVRKIIAALHRIEDQAADS